MSENTEPAVDLNLALAHGLSSEEYEKVRAILGRTPSYTELGIFSLMWSEHCSYKSSRIHLKRFPTTGPQVLQGPGENAGAIDIGGGLAAIFKMESHNHPSYVEPYQGAATGVGGILRDIFTMGARPIASLNSLRFGSPDHPRMRYLLGGVVGGIAGYGNCVGVPTVGGEVAFHPSYNGNILVNVLNLGIAHAGRIFRGQARGPGNSVFYVGSRTGRDGIHGASLLASASFEADSQTKRPTVQVGDPFAEKLLLEACLELMKTDAIIGIQDMGAAGLTSSSVEMAGRGGTGIDLDLDRVPVREEGMTPYEMMLSESQERMLVIVRRGSEEKVRQIFRKWDLEGVPVGEVSAGGSLRVHFRGKRVADIPVKPIADGAPLLKRPMERPAWQDEVGRLDLTGLKDVVHPPKALKGLLGSLNLCSREWIYRQYDHMVRTNTVVRPGSDAAVIRIKGSPHALALTTDCNGRYCYLDPRSGARIAVAEASRNLACSGAVAQALTDCLNFGNPERPEVMWQFSECVDGIGEACRALEIPVISGNVSFYNETEGKGIFPTPTIGMVGIIEDARLAMRSFFCKEADVVVLLGETGEELGGSEYLSQAHRLEAGPLPVLDLEREEAVQLACIEAIGEGLVSSAHDCAEGGIAVALAESCFHPEGMLGAEVTLPAGRRLDAILFGETQSRILLSLPKFNLGKLEKICQDREAPFSLLGAVGGSRLKIHVGEEAVINTALTELKRPWAEALPAWMV
ncbi:MAG: phosphoribosylformylglycinamidine synthase subunit PurL [Acidobacteria bacterium]|nr:MAG: phosphoribosylformylglycinamidine synthase subunit PurL [Acidobacteriota bacterium]